MKNLLIYIHPSKRFGTAYYRNEMQFLVKVQIDNSLAWGWDRKDIMIVTNFPYEYNGVQTIVVPDEVFSVKKRTASKLNAILKLYEMGLITDELYWFHDFDAFQNASIEEIDLGDKEVAMTYSSVRTGYVSTGIIFFSKHSKGIFSLIRKRCDELTIRGELTMNEEDVLNMLLREGGDNFTDKIIMNLNISHNFAIKKRPVADQYAEADKPIKVLHFHPFDNRSCTTEVGKSSLQVVYGDNSFKEPLMGKTLRGIFKQHGL